MSQQESQLPIIGGLIAAVGAGLCCAGPLVLLLLGISGTWISKLTMLEPYQPIFVVLVLGLFGHAGWKLHRPIEACEPGTACAIPEVRRRRQIIFWIAAAVATILASSNYWVVWLAETFE